MNNVELAEAIRKIVDILGVDAFSDSKKFNSLLNDMSPQLIEERKIFHRGLTDKVLMQISTIKNCQEDMRQIEAQKCRKMMINEIGLTDTWISTILNGFSSAFGWNLDTVKEISIESPNDTPNHIESPIIGISMDSDNVRTAEQNLLLKKYNICLQLEDSNMIADILNQYVERFPDDWIGWWEKFKFPFKFGFNCYNDFVECEKYASNAKKLIALATGNVTISDLMTEYDKLWKKYIEEIENGKVKGTTNVILGILLLQGRKLDTLDFFDDDLRGLELTTTYKGNLGAYYGNIFSEDIRKSDSFFGIGQPLRDYLKSGIVNAIKLEQAYNCKIYLGYVIPRDDFKKMVNFMNLETVDVYGKNSEFYYLDDGVKVFFCSEQIHLYWFGKYGKMRFVFWDTPIAIDSFIAKLAKKYQEERDDNKKLFEDRKQKNLCTYCGGNFNFWGDKCKSCGKQKNY